MENTVLTRFYGAPPVDQREILRYAGVFGTKSAEGAQSENAEIEALLEECLAETEGKLSYKVCYREFEITIPQVQNGVAAQAAGSGPPDKKTLPSAIDLGFASVNSGALAVNLRGCSRIILFAATIGFEIDRLIAKANRLSPSKALFFQAIGAERIESLCDVFNKEIRKEYEHRGLFLRPRFSPGYGDLPLALQKDIFAVLDCPRKIGVTLNESLLMSPSKSVTAIIGITGEKLMCGNTENKCETCTNENCIYRESVTE